MCDNHSDEDALAIVAKSNKIYIIRNGCVVHTCSSKSGKRVLSWILQRVQHKLVHVMQQSTFQCIRVSSAMQLRADNVKLRENPIGR